MKPQFVQETEKINKQLTGLDPNFESKAQDYLEVEKKKDLANSKAAREWEKDRKKEWAANKPAYLKSLKKEDPARPIINEIKNGGKFNSTIHPVAGYILVKVDEVEQNEAGIFIVKQEDAPNTAIVIESGNPIVYDHGVRHAPCYADEHILFRKFAGMNVEMKGKKYLMLHFDDVIATLE